VALFVSLIWESADELAGSLVVPLFVSTIWDSTHKSASSFGYQTILPALKYRAPFPCERQSASVDVFTPKFAENSSGENKLSRAYYIGQAPSGSCFFA
jgi:hypothetical protein